MFAPIVKLLLISTVLFTSSAFACGSHAPVLEENSNKIKPYSRGTPSNGLYRLTPMGWNAGEENLREMIESDRIRGVPYLNTVERENYRVFFTKGLIYSVVSNRPLNDSKLNTNESGKPKTFIFVMDVSGRFYIATRAQVKNHSSFFSGQPVASAGIMKILDGKLLEINNYSGHYRTPMDIFDQALYELAIQRVRKFKIIRYGWED